MQIVNSSGAEGEYVLTRQGDSEARIEIAGEEWGNVIVSQLDSEGRPLGEVDARGQGAQLQRSTQVTLWPFNIAMKGKQSRENQS